MRYLFLLLMFVPTFAFAQKADSTTKAPKSLFFVSIGGATQTADKPEDARFALGSVQHRAIDLTASYMKNVAPSLFFGPILQFNHTKWEFYPEGQLHGGNTSRQYSLDALIGLESYAELNEIIKKPWNLYTTAHLLRSLPDSWFDIRTGGIDWRYGIEVGKQFPLGEHSRIALGLRYSRQHRSEEYRNLVWGENGRPVLDENGNYLFDGPERTARWQEYSLGLRFRVFFGK